jgi:hypothetical protein
LVSAPFPEFVYSDDGSGLSSCSAAEALERQVPFVNPALANDALVLFARLFRHGTISHHDAFVSISSIAAPQALPVDPKYWPRLLNRGKTKPALYAQDRSPGSIRRNS